MVSLGAFWMVFLQFSYLIYMQNRCNLVPLPIFFMPDCEKVTAKPA